MFTEGEYYSLCKTLRDDKERMTVLVQMQSHDPGAHENAVKVMSDDSMGVLNDFLAKSRLFKGQNRMETGSAQATAEEIAEQEDENPQQQAAKDYC